MKFKLLILFVLLTSLGCKRQEAHGVKIGYTLYVHQSLLENYELRSLIGQALKKDSQALAKLSDFPCGGGGGCYDLGIVLAELLYRIGETDFIVMVSELPQNQKSQIKSFLSVGLQYGDFNADGKDDLKWFEKEFPRLNNELSK
jgi:hypothetical protein